MNLQHAVAQLSNNERRVCHSRSLFCAGSRWPVSWPDHYGITSADSTLKRTGEVYEIGPPPRERPSSEEEGGQAFKLERDRVVRQCDGGWASRRPPPPPPTWPAAAGRPASGPASNCCCRRCGVGWRGLGSVTLALSIVDCQVTRMYFTKSMNMKIYGHKFGH